MRTMIKIIMYIIFTVFIQFNSGTVDVTLPEFEYLANHMTKDECHRLIASLHFKSFNLNKNLENAEDALPEDVSCLKLLLHWNSSPQEGKGATHEKLALRLRQLGKPELAAWLDSAVLQELDEGINKMADSFQDPDQPEKELNTEASVVTPIEIPASALNGRKDTESLEDEDSWWDIIISIFVIILVISVGVYLFLKVNACVEMFKYNKIAMQAFTVDSNKNVPGKRKIEH